MQDAAPWCNDAGGTGAGRVWSRCACVCVCMCVCVCVRKGFARRSTVWRRERRPRDGGVYRGWADDAIRLLPAAIDATTRAHKRWPLHTLAASVQCTVVCCGGVLSMAEHAISRFGRVGGRGCIVSAKIRERDDESITNATAQARLVWVQVA